MNRIRQQIRDLSFYHVQQRTEGIKVNQNESPFDLPGQLKREAMARLQKLAWNRYPSLLAEGLMGAIARYTGVEMSHIVMGNGSNELIQALFSATCSVGDRALVISPGFSIYPMMGDIMGIGLITVPLKRDFSFDVPAIIERSKGAQIIIFASPNNPTGTSLAVDEIACIAEHCENLLVIDEAYYEFSGVSAQCLLDRYRNVVILRTFSKACGLAGIRLGYALGDQAIMRHLRKTRLPFSVGIMQQVVGELLLEHTEVIARAAKEIIRQREVLFLGLQNMEGVTPIPSRANFILFKIAGNSSRSIYKRMLEKGVLLRWFDHPRLTHMLRVTVGSAPENRRFLSCLEEVLSEVQDDMEVNHE